MAKQGLEVNFDIVNIKNIEAKINEISKQINDLRPVFSLFSLDFYRYEKRIFGLRGPGKYKDLSTKPFRAFWRNKRGYAAL